MDIADKKVIFQFNLIPMVCIMIAAGLCGWGIGSLGTENMEILTGIGSGVTIALMFGVALCCSGDRQAVMIKTGSICFAVGAIIFNVILASVCATPKPYIIASGIYLMLWALTIYGLYKSRTV